MSDKVEISGSNSSKPSSEVSPSTIFYYVMPPWYSRCEKENSRRIGNYGKTSSCLVFRAALYAIDSKLGLGLGKDFEN